MKLRQLSSIFAKPVLLISVSLLLTPAFAADREGDKPCPAINPNSDFLTNFNNSCYALSLIPSNGLNFSGDSNAVYDSVYYMVTPGYELVLVGTFPNARYMSVTVYDEHLAITSDIIDQNIPPLNSTMTNPFEVGATYQPNLTYQYGMTIGFGGTLTSTPSPGCSASDTTIDQTVLDASQIHSGLTWLNYPGLPTDFPVHQTGANSSGVIMVRKYIPIANNIPETVIVRQLSSGCAMPLQKALSTGILSVKAGLSSTTYFNQPQITAHQEFSNQIEQLQCNVSDKNNQKQWFRSVDYIPVANLANSMDVNLTSANMQPLLSGQQFIRLRFPVPTTPITPCLSGGCTLTGNEDLRYYSVSFLGPSTPQGKTTLLSLGDTAFTPAVDPNGNVTLIVGLGAQPPAFLTASNYYVYLDLTTVPNYTTLSRIELRHLLPNANFNCSSANVPLFTMEYNNVGGYMGQYVPTFDFPTPAALESPAPPPPVRPNSCAASPTASPVACGPAQ